MRIDILRGWVQGVMTGACAVVAYHHANPWMILVPLVALAFDARMLWRAE